MPQTVQADRSGQPQVPPSSKYRTSAHSIIETGTQGPEPYDSTHFYQAASPTAFKCHYFKMPPTVGTL